MIESEYSAAATTPLSAGLGRARRRGGGRRAVVLTGALVGGIFVGASGLAYAATVTGRVVWDHGHRLERLQHRVHAALDSVGATTVQEDKVHDLIAAGFGTMGDSRADKMALRKQMLDLLRAPTIDRAAVEKLRADQVARFDAKSKAMVGMVLDSAGQLTADQRARLADRAEAMMDHGPRGWHHGEGSGDGRGDEDMHHHGPAETDHGPDNPG